MLWSVYGDCIVVRRLDFSGLETLELGPKWVMPLPAAESRPFAFAERAKKIAAPQFASDATLVVKRVVTKNRGGKNPKDENEAVPSVEKPGYELAIPPATGRDGARAIRYNVVASASGESIMKRVMAEGFSRAPSAERAKAPTCIRFAADELPKGDVSFSVTPVNSFGREGRPLMARTT